MLWLLTALVAAAVAYVFARPYLIQHFGFWGRFCDWIDPLIVSWLSRSRTVALARAYQWAGYLVSGDAFIRPILVESGLVSVDWVSLFSIPDPWGKIIGPALAATGLVFAKLRKVTDTAYAEKA
jgi:hypothetical protein